MFGFGIAIESLGTVRCIQPERDLSTSVVIDTEYGEVLTTYVECRHAVRFLFPGFR